MKSLKFSIFRQLLQHKEFYMKEVRPFLASMHPHAASVCNFVPPSLLPFIRSQDGKDSLQFNEAVRNSTENISVAMEALSHMRLLDRRRAASIHQNFSEVRYSLQVGDVVRHTHLGQVGVVAAQFPICPESDEWVLDNLGSTGDERMKHPWYLILVAHHEGIPLDFMRYGSQLTHTKINMSIGYHRFLPVYFKGYDRELGVYIPRNPAEIAPMTHRIRDESLHGIGACDEDMEKKKTEPASSSIQATDATV